MFPTQHCADADGIATAQPEPTVVIVPGLRDDHPDHWQTLLAERLERARTVPPLQAQRLSRAAQVAALEEVLRSVSGPVVLVAHSAGVLTVVHWAQAPTREIAGALLVTPADLEQELPQGYPSLADLTENGWNPIPRRTLPFPSTLVLSTDDPLARWRRVTGMAESWGCRVVNLGAVGHLNPAGGYGHWPRAEHLLAEVLATARTRTAHSAVRSTHCDRVRQPAPLAGTDVHSRTTPGIHALNVGLPILVEEAEALDQASR